MKKLFIPCYYKKDLTPVLEESLESLKGHKNIGIYTTAQHLNQLQKAKNFFEKNDKKVIFAKQVLGCSDVPKTDADAIVYIGSGRFHLIGIATKTEKPVIVLNPYSDSVDIIKGEDKERLRKHEKGKLLKLLAAETIGILVSTKPGQFGLDDALKLKKKYEKKGKKAFILAGDELSQNNLLPFKVDVWVNTACPRLEDDLNRGL